MSRSWCALSIALAACGASAPPSTAPSAASAWADALTSSQPLGCTLAPIWAHHVVWPVTEGPLAEFATAHQDETELVAVPDALAPYVPHPAQTFVPTADGLCAATLGPAQLRPDPTDPATFLRAVNGCAEQSAPFAFLCPAEVRVPTDLHWAPFTWSAITPAAEGGPIVDHAMAARHQLEDVTDRNAAGALEGATEIDRARSASVIVGTDEIDAAQLGLAWFDSGVDVETGCPAVDIAAGEITTHADARWTRLAVGETYIGVLHDGHHVIGFVEDTFSVETESCDGEHSCFFVAIATREGSALIVRSRAISQLTGARIARQSPLRFMDTRAPCNERDE